ncbi:MAG TPA: DUF3857 domain-containing protein [Chitinophagaceae bacterium]|nr:DUF3857 domain-containing protein [Chitinophagaceae bacterium]
MHKLRFLTCLFFLLSTLQGFAQKTTAKIKFGDVKPEDFQPTVYSVDSSANAVILADIGDSKFIGNSDGDFSLAFNHIRRIRILNKNGFDNATIQILLYTNGTNSGEEQLKDFEAATYNLENGKVVVTKLDKASLFKDKYDKYHTVRKFTFPNIKEGSIVEYKYTIISPYYANLQPWSFQAQLPRLWSEYQVTIPSDIFDYVLTKQGYLPYKLDTSTFSKETYNILAPGDATESSQVVSISSNTLTAHWIMENVPPIKDETFVTSLDNYRSRIEFQLRRIKYSATNIVDYMGNWNQFVDKLMKDDDFGVPIQASNGWLNDDLKSITAGATDSLKKAEKWYNYVRDNFTWNGDEGKYLSKPLKKTFQDKNGSVADINLLLLVGLSNLGFDVHPAVLSTRDNGKASELYPVIGQYNYVVCSTTINGKQYTLDATNKMFGFGKLPAYLYNGSARLIAPLPLLIPLVADSLKESKVTTVFMMNDDSLKGLSGTYTSRLGEHEGVSFREKMAKESNQDFFKEQKKEYSFETDITNGKIDSLKIPDEPVTVKYNFTLKPGDDDIIYVNPLLTETYKENPFKSAERLYPVEMPYCSDETYILNMEIPKGYKVEELPKSARVKLNEDEGMFEYIIGQGGGRIQLRCRVILNKATFESDDYQTLRDFFGYVVKKEAEQIVLKKI